MSRRQKKPLTTMSLIYVTFLCALCHHYSCCAGVNLDMKTKKTNFLRIIRCSGICLLFFNQPLYCSQVNEYVGNTAKPSINIPLNKLKPKNYNQIISLKSIEFMTTPAQLLENSLLVIWNDRNADRRLEAMKKTYAPDVHFYEFNTGEAIIGYKAINELISKLQKDWPPESRFELNKPSQVNHSIQIASWNLGSAGTQPIATGMDVAVIENNLIKSFYLFLDAPEKNK